MIDEQWVAVSRVPENRLKTIGFGNLKGKSDINPQWRIKAMTETYGMCGVGWYHELKQREVFECSNGEVIIFCDVNVYTKEDDGWSKPIVGSGGNKIVSKNKNGLVPNDEAWKMAYTDALGTALKSIGVASEIYEGNFDGSKYQQPQSATPEPPKPLPSISNEEADKLVPWGFEKGYTGVETVFAARASKTVTNEQANSIVDRVDALHQKRVEEERLDSIAHQADMESMNG
jgi:hypothetical protein